ncbi:hypothetical protein HAX54_051702 [Datura stramonium]|uniref:Uncharacterized protein n=1 Tax=Datura stramonium TaxID=4076 RepID=A0ABS8SYV2_DATST|nr:hypothetical protein [Datura stramonium]
MCRACGGGGPRIVMLKLKMKMKLLHFQELVVLAVSYSSFSPEYYGSWAVGVPSALTILGDHQRSAWRFKCPVDSNFWQYSRGRPPLQLHFLLRHLVSKRFLLPKGIGGGSSPYYRWSLLAALYESTKASPKSHGANSNRRQCCPAPHGDRNRDWKPHTSWGYIPPRVPA